MKSVRIATSLGGHLCNSVKVKIAKASLELGGSKRTLEASQSRIQCNPRLDPDGIGFQEPGAFY